MVFPRPHGGRGALSVAGARRAPRRALDGGESFVSPGGASSVGGGTLRSPPGSLSPPAQGPGTGRSEARGIRGEPDPSCHPHLPTRRPLGALLGGSRGSATPSPASPGGAA